MKDKKCPRRTENVREGQKTIGGNDMFKRLIKSKVFWTSVGGIFVAIGTMVVGEVTVAQGLVAIFGALIVIFFRDTIAKIK